MLNFSTQRERGFTLIEMSIVLIIIGLIIGGILKGQELIESARQKNFVAQTDAIKAASNSFLDRFRAFPGDYGTSPCGTICVAGDDDGILNTNPGTGGAAMAALTTHVTGEQYEFFNHLAGAGFLSGVGANAVAQGSANYSGGANISPLPQSAFPQSGLTIVYGTAGGGSGNLGSLLTHWLYLHRYVAGAVTTTQAVLAPARMAQLDVKFDDGIGSTGRIRTDNLDSSCGAEGGVTAYAQETNVQCSLLMQLD